MSCRIPSNLESNIEIKETLYQDKIILFDSLKQEFQKYYEFKEVTLNLGIHTFFLIFVIPKRIPKIYQKDYKALDSQRKDYGIGYFKELLEYNKDYKETNTQNNPYTPFLLYHTRVFLAPAKAKKIHFEFALGLDNYIESKDKESNTNVCKFKVLSGDVIEEREEVEGGGYDISDNVIRIETEDGSGEYIEIVLPKEADEQDLLDKVGDIALDIAQGAGELALAAISKGRYRPKPKTPKKTIQTIKKSKYATKQEVINTLKNKYGLKTSQELNDMGYKQFPPNKTVFMAKDNKQIKEIWEDITEGAEILEDKSDSKGQYMIKMRRLSDGTILKLRKTSDFKGSTIEIGNKGDRKIHNKAGEDGDW